MPKRLKFLVVDDDPVVVEVARARLENLGHEVTVHDRGLGTNRIVLKNQPHLVLLDVEMPGLDGDQLVDLIQENCWIEGEPWPAVILHSGKEETALRELAHKTGAAGSIAKTPDTDVFNGRLQAIVEELTR